METTRKYTTYICWAAQILLWAAILTLLYVLFDNSPKDKGGSAVCIFFFFAYVIYILLNFVSPMYSCLFNQKSSNSIHEYMKSLFYNPPVIEWQVECYHYEMRLTSWSRKRRSTREKIVTHRESERFRFFTWRDISGNFKLDSQKVLRSEDNIYIKLDLGLHFDFADEMSKVDYQFQKDSFYNRNKRRDVYISFKETTTITGYNEYNLIKISDKDAPFVSKSVYIIFMFLIPFMEIYKLYINKFCAEQDYTIKKVVSTRSDLIRGEENNKWLNFIPSINIFNQNKISYDEAPQPVSDNFQLPTLEEINRAKTFNHTVSFQLVETDNYSPYFDDSTPGQGVSIPEINNNASLSIELGVKKEKDEDFGIEGDSKNKSNLKEALI